MYVDNLGCLTTGKAEADEAVRTWRSEFEEAGLLMHKGQVTSEATEVLGTEVDGSKHTIAVTAKRVVKIQAATQGLLERKRVCGWTLEVVVGHITFCALAQRGLLSVLSSVYSFIRLRYNEPTVLWNECRQELRCISGLLWLARASWDTPWHTMVYQSDASLTGYGVKTAEWPLDIVREVGRVNERRRFKRTGGHTAREGALAAARLSRVNGVWLCTKEEIDDELGENWKVDGSFPEVPAAGLRESLWHTVRLGRWQRSEDIVILEARACEKAV